MNHRLTALALFAFPTLAAADPRPAPIARSVHVQISDPGDPAGGLELFTSLIGEHACTSVVLDDRTTRRKLELCATGSEERPNVDLRLERGGAAGAVDVHFAAVAPRGQRTRLGKVALDARRSIEAHVTVTTDAP